MPFKIFFFIFSFFILSTGALLAQSLYFTRNGQISFFSETPFEDIKADNNKVYSSLNAQTGFLQFLVTIKNFEFKRDAMQRHFNDEDYMHSDKYPSANFKGRLLDIEAIDFSKNGKYTTLIEGELNIHGITNAVKTSAILQVQNERINASATFYVRLEDYKIKVPKIVFKKIAEVVRVDVMCDYQILKSN